MADPATKSKATSRSSAPKAPVKASPKAKPKAAKPGPNPPAQTPTAQTPTAQAAPAPKDLALLLGSDNSAALERLSSNLARAALTAQGALAGAAFKNAENPGALNPDPFNAVPAMSAVISKLAAQPDRLFKAQTELVARYMDLWQSAAKRIADGEIAPPW